MMSVGVMELSCITKFRLWLFSPQFNKQNDTAENFDFSFCDTFCVKIITMAYTDAKVFYGWSGEYAVQIVNLLTEYQLIIPEYDSDNESDFESDDENHSESENEIVYFQGKACRLISSDENTRESPCEDKSKNTPIIDVVLIDDELHDKKPQKPKTLILTRLFILYVILIDTKIVSQKVLINV